MAFGSSTKSWGMCNKDQRRECIAHAAFNKLSGFYAGAVGLVGNVKRDLLRKIGYLKQNESLSSEETVLVILEGAIKGLGENVAGIEGLQRMYSKVKDFVTIDSVGGLGSGHIKSFIENGELSKIAAAQNKFEWSGSGGAPKGKSESTIGISDSLAEKLLSLSGGSSTLTSWLQAGDAKWKKWVDSEVKIRKNEIAVLKRSGYQDARVKMLEAQIKKLEKECRL